MLYDDDITINRTNSRSPSRNRVVNNNNNDNRNHRVANNNNNNDSNVFSTMYNPMFELLRTSHSRDENDTKRRSHDEDWTNDLRKRSLDEEEANELVSQSLAKLNPYLAKKLSAQQSMLLYEIKSCGSSEYRHMTLRELLQYVNAEAYKCDGISNLYSDGISNIPIRSSSKVNHSVPFLQYRDLRRLELSYDNVSLEVPKVLVRRHSVLVNIYPLRAIILADRMILLVPDGTDSLLAILGEHMQSFQTHDIVENRTTSFGDFGNIYLKKLGGEYSNLVSFECRAYEAVVATVAALQTQEYDVCRELADRCIEHFDLSSIVDIEVQEDMRILKNRVGIMESRTRSSRASLMELIETVEDLSLMHLTRLKSNPSLYNYPLSSEILDIHEEIEILLEPYVLDFSSLEVKLQFLKTQLTNAEELVLLRLDTSRNRLLIADTTIAVISCAIGIGSYFGQMFGTNFISDIYDTRGNFEALITVTSILITLFCFMTLYYLRITGILPGSNIRKFSSLNASFGIFANKKLWKPYPKFDRTDMV
jgi:hypothetical protein